MGKGKLVSSASGNGFLVASLAGAALLSVVLGVSRAEAIPAFSREYKTECTTCHTIFPQRNEFGQAFEKNGFVWPGAATKVKRVAQTEEERRSAEYLGLSGIPAEIPISALMSATYQYDDTAEDEFDMKRYNLELLGGGAFGGDRIGFWFNEGLGSQSGGPTGPSQVYFVARHPLSAPVHVKVGKFAPDLSLWFGSDHLIGRPLSVGASVDGFTATSSRTALEISTFLGPRAQAVIGMNDRDNSSDKANPKSVNDFYARVGVKFGGADYQGKEPDVDLEKDSVWDYLSVTCGAYGYSGSTSVGDGVDHDLTRIGIEAGAAYKKFILMLGATVGENYAGEDGQIDSTAASAELNYLFSAKWALAVRYDHVDVDGKETRGVLTPGVLYAPLQNFKLSLRVAADTNPTNAAEGEADENTTATLSASMTF